MRVSYHLFYLKLGLSFRPMQESYQEFGHLATHSWMKMLWEKLSLFDIEAVFADVSPHYPQDGDQFIMQVLLRAGYKGETLRHLNKVRISQQVLFLSDILTASGGRVDPTTLSHRPRLEARSKMRWPVEQPSESDLRLWHDAITSLCLSRRGTRPVEPNIGISHRVWRWFWNNNTSSLHHVCSDGNTEDIYVADRKPNRFRFSHKQARTKLNVICSVQRTIDDDQWRLLSTAPTASLPQAPCTYIEVLESWGNTWLWDDLTVSGGINWIGQAIANRTLVAVTDGSYIRELYPNLCSAAFVLECSTGLGRVYGLFSERLLVANAYQGELLGLMAVHLILLSVNKIHPRLSGHVEVVSDCLGALKRVSHLPPCCIPSRCCHSDILKTILVHCRGLSFTMDYVHVKAHQDDKHLYSKLSRKAQLNCICDHAAKVRISTDGMETATPGQMFPLEPVGIFMGNQKMTSDTSNHIQFWAHRRLAHIYFHDHKILSTAQFNQVDWKSVHSTLHGLPRLFQLWASKHVLGVAGTMKFLSHQDDRSQLCPSCEACNESCRHVA